MRNCNTKITDNYDTIRHIYNVAQRDVAIFAIRLFGGGDIAHICASKHLCKAFGRERLALGGKGGAIWHTLAAVLVWSAAHGNIAAQQWGIASLIDLVSDSHTTDRCG